MIRELLQRRTILTLRENFQTRENDKGTAIRFPCLALTDPSVAMDFSTSSLNFSKPPGSLKWRWRAIFETAQSDYIRFTNISRYLEATQSFPLFSFLLSVLETTVSQQLKNKLEY